MFINIIDKYISNFIDLFYIHRIKGNKIKNDSSVINVINNFLSNKIETVFEFNRPGKPRDNLLNKWKKLR